MAKRRKVPQPLPKMEAPRVLTPNPTRSVQLVRSLKLALTSVVIPLVVSGLVALYSYRLQQDQRTQDRMEALLDEVNAIKREVFKFDTGPQKRMVQNHMMERFSEDRGIVFPAAEYEGVVDRLSNIRIKMHLYYSPATSSLLDSIGFAVADATTGPSLKVHTDSIEWLGFEVFWLSVDETRALSEGFRRLTMDMANELESYRRSGQQGYWVID